MTPFTGQIISPLPGPAKGLRPLKSFLIDSLNGLEMLSLESCQWLHCCTLPDLSFTSMTTRLLIFCLALPSSVKTFRSFVFTALGTRMRTSA